MGCLFSKTNSPSAQTLKEEQDPPKQYSWDKREKINPKDFMVENLKSETVCKSPKSIKGQQFIIQNCQDCTIYVMDHMATVSVDDCTNCRIFLGPIKSSIFVRDCSDCKMVIACQQFRSRDCKGMDVFLCCATQPIIESSTRMKFGCFQYFYPELEAQFLEANLSVYNNNWSNVHDFTPVPGEQNFTLMTREDRVKDYIPFPNCLNPAAMDDNLSVVPETLGNRRKVYNESCLVVFFNDHQFNERIKTFIKKLLNEHTDCILVQTKEVDLKSAEAARIFETNGFSSAVTNGEFIVASKRFGPVVGLEYNGNNVCQTCQAVVQLTCSESPGLVFVSSSSEAAVEQIDNFYSFAQMQMAI